MQLRKCDQENLILRDILSSRGIQYEAEMQNRKNGMGLGPQGSRGMSPNYPVARTSPYDNVNRAPPSTSGYSGMHEPAYANGTVSSASGHSPITHHSHSPHDHQDQGPCGIRDPLTPDVGGVFEKDPQLGVDFILA